MHLKHLFVLVGLLAPVSAQASAQSDLLGPTFSSFVDSVLAAPTDQRAALVDSFIVRVAPTPFVESDSVAYFLFKGEANSVGVPGDFNGWEPAAYLMTRLAGTDLWYYEGVFEPQARLDYKLVIDGSQWFLDPLNPNTVTGGFGPNSELAMPAYVQPPEIEAYPDIEHGTVIDHRNFASAFLGDMRTVRVYLPAGYEDAADRRYGVMLFHDGLEYFSIGRAKNVLDFLISEDRVEPVIGVFVPPNHRVDEYAFTLTGAYERFVVDELMPFIDASYRTTSDPDQRGTIGVSAGGHISALLCYRHPEAFGLCGLASPSLQVNGGALVQEIESGPKKDIRFYVDWGTYESVIETAASGFVEKVAAKGYDYVANVWFEGHSWGSWRAHLSHALEYLFPVSTETGALYESTPERTHGTTNFPNPFSDETRLAIWLDRPGIVEATVYDLMGRTVGAFSGHHPAGESTLLFSGDGLVDGHYLFQVRTEPRTYQGMMTRVR